MVATLAPHAVRVSVLALLLLLTPLSLVSAQENSPTDPRLIEARQSFNDALEHLRRGLPADARRAQELLEPALEAFRRARRESAEADALGALGLAHAQVGDTVLALELYRQALNLQEMLGDRQEAATTLNNIGLLLAETGRPIEAFEHLEAALLRRRATGDLQGEAAALNNLAALHVQLGEIQSGLDQYHRALALHRQLGDSTAEAASLNNLGLAFAQVGEHRRAETYLRRALVLHRANGRPLEEAGTLGNLGLANLELGRPALALGQLTAARDLYRSVGDPAGEGQMLNNLGLIHLEAEQLEPARRALEAALKIQRTARDDRAEAATLTNLGQLLRKLRQPISAQAHLERALDLQRRLEDPWGASFTLLELAYLAAENATLEIALSRTLEARRIVDSRRAELSSPSHRTSLVDHRREIYEFHIDLLMRLHHQHPDAGHGAAALVADEAARARGLLESLNVARAGLLQEIDPDLSAARRRLSRRIGALDSKRIQLQRQGQDRRAAEVDDEIEALLEKDQRLDGEIRARHPRYAKLLRPEPLTADALRQLLDEDTLVLKYNLGEERSVLWAVTSQRITSHMLADRKTLETAARRLHERLVLSRQRAFQGPTRLAAIELAELLLAPVRGDLSKRRIAVVTDGALAMIPFALLPSNVTDGRTLGLDHDVLVLPSMTFLASSHEDQPDSELPDDRLAPTIAILADPVFDSHDPRLEEHRLADSPGSGPTSLRDLEPLPRLIHSRQEARKIAAMVSTDQRFLALGFEARRELLTEGTLEAFRIIHIATHGIVDAERPDLSALVFSRLDSQNHWHDGRLRLLDIYKLRLRSDLVVLSACRTALGREMSGEGLISLARGFMYAGARQVLVSLWQVDDEATAVLMEHFYRGLLVEGIPAAAALRAAQQQLASDRRWQAPYYWAGFVLQGD